jgi:hypothetical protein
MKSSLGPLSKTTLKMDQTEQNQNSYNSLIHHTEFVSNSPVGTFLVTDGGRDIKSLVLDDFFETSLNDD